MFGLPSFVVYIIIALILTKIPFVGKYFRLVNTLIHEVGHVLMSLLTSGKVYKVQLFSDTSGVAVTGSTGWFSKVLTSLAGYPFASVVAFIYIYLIHVGREEWVLYTLMALLVASLIFWVRNWFGFFWTVIFLTGTILVTVYASEELVLMYLMLVIAVLLVESVSSAIVIFWLSFKNPKDSGDAQNLAQSTYVPSIVWGTLFMVQSFYFFGSSIKYWM